MSDEKVLKKRLFTAVEIPDSLRERIANMAGELEPDMPQARWVPIENLHVTLKFLGSVEASRIPDMVEVMRSASELLPASVAIGGLGAFPSPGSARVIWVGVEDEMKVLTRIYRVLDKGAVRCGVSREKRKYHPHVTIGRAKKKPLRIPTEALQRFDHEAILEVKDIVLYESKQKSGGVEYSVVEKVPGSSGSF